MGQSQNKGIRIAIADDEPSMLEYLQTVLPALGYMVISSSKSADELLKNVDQDKPDLVITDIKMPPGMDGLDAAKIIYDTWHIPVIIVSGLNEENTVKQMLQRAATYHVAAYIMKPVRKEELLTIIPIAIQRFKEFDILLAEKNSAEQALADRKVVERAKGILQRTQNKTEEEAFFMLQKLATSNHKKIVEVAQSIIDHHNLMESL